MIAKYCIVAALACWAVAPAASAAAAAGSNKVSFNAGAATKKASGKANLLAGLGTMKIIGGKPATTKQRPYMAEIGIQSGKKYNPQCGGTILDKRHILSAAHCFTNRSLAYRVRVGSDKWASGGQLVNVASIMVHPQNNKAAQFDYDVAVLRVDKDLVFGQAVKAVSLVPVARSANVATMAANTDITLIGWGYTDAMHADPLPAALREVQISTIATSECTDDYVSYGLTLTARMFCGMTPEKDSCQGDSGGPVINSKTNQQVGVISWGLGCAQMGSPGVFVNLADPSVRSFIASSQKK